MKKLDFYGETYLTEYAEIEFEKQRKEKIYRNYVTKSLEIMTCNTFGDERYKLTQSYDDLIESKIKEEANQENIEDIKKRQNEALKRLARRWKK